ncbi:MAG: hypothetical protein GY898_26970 [Proteobacteria bacterium]|nr:hypothetical protein [Pseudomonadota bacterium]
MPRLPTVLCLLLTGCVYTPPGDGTPKGCVEDVTYPGTLAEGFGISTHLEPGNSDTDVARRAFETAAWQEIGVGTVRRDFAWAQIEPEQGAFDFSGTDRLVDAAEAAGVDLLPILDYGVPWASADGSHGPPEDPADFAAFAGVVAERYRGRISAYEVWNEQNVGLVFWPPQEDPEAYGALLAATSDAIAEADPDATVSFGGVFGPELVLNTDGETFIQQTADALGDLGDHIDVMAFHPYRYPFSAPEHSDENQRSLTDDICSLAELMDDLGAPEHPLWMTELGWHTAPDALVAGVDDTTQGAYLIRSAMIGWSQGVERFYWYTFRDSGLDLDDQEQRFGLYDYDPDPLDDRDPASKSADAFRTLSSALADHTRVEDRSTELGLDGSAWALRVSGGSEAPVTVLWSTDGQEHEVLVPRQGPATLVDATGAEVELFSSGGAWEVPLGPVPRFLSER